MEILSGRLWLLDDIIEADGDETIGLLESQPCPSGTSKIILINLGRRGMFTIFTTACFLIQIKNNETRLEKIEFEELNEDIYFENELKLLPYLQSKGINCRYRKNGKYNVRFSYERTEVILSENGYLQVKPNGSIIIKVDDNYFLQMYKTDVNYKRGQLTIDGKEVKRWGFEDDMTECKDMAFWVKNSFQYKQQLSMEEFMSLADKWSKVAMKRFERYISPVFVEFYDGSRFEEITPSAKEFLKGDTKTIIFRDTKGRNKTEIDTYSVFEDVL